MSFFVSPSIEIVEKDLTLYIPSLATAITGVAGKYSWGPCFEKTQITNEGELLSNFRGPNSSNFAHWFSAAEFLRYAKNLWIVRAVDADTAKNAGITVNDEDQSVGPKTMSSALYIPNRSNIPTITFGSNEKLHIVAKYPGSIGNSIIKVAVASADDFGTAEIYDGLTFAESFEFAPESNAYDYYDQIAIVVLVKNVLDNNWSIVEKWIVDLDPNAKDAYNKSNYIENVINAKSNWIYAFDNSSNHKSVKSFEATLLQSGVDGDPADGDMQLAYDEFANAEDFDVNLLIDGGNTSAVMHGYIIDICEERKDCMSVLCIPEDEMVGIQLATAINNCVTYRNTTLNRTSTYAALYANAKYMYDKYNDIYRWIPISGDIAGLIAETDRSTEPWYAPAGLNRGQLRNVSKLAISPKKAHRSTLYQAAINPVVGFSGQGFVIWGQKTLTIKPSAFNRINVRRLFLVLEKAIATACKWMLFEFNDEYQRNLFKMMVDPYLKRVQSRRGIYEYKIICDSTNNTPSVIDNNEFVGDIYIKPSRVIEGMQLNFIAASTGTSFNEIQL